MSVERHFLLPDEEATVAFGRQLAPLLREGAVLYLDGGLGAGKTTLCRGIVVALGHCGAVKSPTYTLVEPYDLPTCQVYHFDLYRLGDPEELELMGGRDYFDGRCLCLVEWYVRGEGYLPAPDLLVKLSVEKSGGRELTLVAHSQQGERVVNALPAR